MTLPGYFPSKPRKTSPLKRIHQVWDTRGVLRIFLTFGFILINGNFVAQFFTLQYSGEENALDASFPSLS